MEPTKHERLTARAIVRTLDACGDNTEKKERFLAEHLRQLALKIADQQETISELRRVVIARDGKLLRRGRLYRKSLR